MDPVVEVVEKLLTNTFFDKSTLSCLFLALGCFWPLIASMTSEVKNNYAYVIMQDICNKFIEVNFCVGCVVSSTNVPHNYIRSNIYWNYKR